MSIKQRLGQARWKFREWRPVARMTFRAYQVWLLILLLLAATPSIFILTERPLKDTERMLVLTEWRTIALASAAALFALLTQARVRFINRAEQVALAMRSAIEKCKAVMDLSMKGAMNGGCTCYPAPHEDEVVQCHKALSEAYALLYASRLGMVRPSESTHIHVVALAHYIKELLAFDHALLSEQEYRAKLNGFETLLSNAASSCDKIVNVLLQ